MSRLLQMVPIALILVLLGAGCSPDRQKHPPRTSAPTPGPSEGPGFAVVDTGLPLSWTVEENTLSFNWPATADYFLYEKEECNYPVVEAGMYAPCQWEVVDDVRARLENGRYIFVTEAKKKFFPTISYKLAPTVPHTVRWTHAGYDHPDSYQVFFIGKRGYQYSRDGIPLDQDSLLFGHLDPRNLPYTFTVYVRARSSDAVVHADRQYEIGSEQFTTIGE